MGLFSFFRKPKEYFSLEDRAQIVNAIRSAEQTTSGEIRVFVEGKNPYVKTLDRAEEIFINLKMEKTAHRNAVLLYIAMDHHEIALYADEGIFKSVGAEFWNNSVKEMISQFTKHNISNGIEQCILQVGKLLKEKFPYESTTDKNELPDEIVFGK